MAKNVKKRHWAFVVYPEGNPPAPKDWQGILQRKGLQCAISPLHEGEMNADESEKKAHWHVIACWPGPTTYSVVKAITDELNAPVPQPLESVRGYYRYLTHKDNPEKKQYDERDIVSVNGFSIADFVELTISEIDAICLKLQTLIRERDIQEYSALLIYLQDEDMRTEYSIARRNTLFFDRFIASRRHVAKEEAGKAAEEYHRLYHESQSETDKLREQLRQVTAFAKERGFVFDFRDN